MLSLFNWGTPHYLSFVLIMIEYVKTFIRTFFVPRSFKILCHATSSINTWQKSPPEKKTIHLLHRLSSTSSTLANCEVSHFRRENVHRLFFLTADQFQLKSKLFGKPATKSASSFFPHFKERRNKHRFITLRQHIHVYRLIFLALSIVFAFKSFYIFYASCVTTTVFFSSLFECYNCDESSNVCIIIIIMFFSKFLYDL